MTDRKEKILNVALESFANEGYNAVSTNKIAKRANVSEGLIFKHFKNKQGLLDAIMQDAEVRVNQMFALVMLDETPKSIISKMIELPFSIPEDEYDFWRLQFKLKWQKEYHNPQKMQPMVDKITWAFAELGYKQPALEAELLSHLLDGIAKAIIREGREKQMKFKDFLKEKYKVA